MADHVGKNVEQEEHLSILGEREISTLTMEINVVAPPETEL